MDSLEVVLRGGAVAWQHAAQVRAIGGQDRAVRALRPRQHRPEGLSEVEDAPRDDHVVVAAEDDGDDYHTHRWPWEERG